MLDNEGHTALVGWTEQQFFTTVLYINSSLISTIVVVEEKQLRPQTAGVIPIEYTLAMRFVALTSAKRVETLSEVPSVMRMTTWFAEALRFGSTLVFKTRNALVVLLFPP